MSDVTFPDTGDLTPGYEWTNPATGVEYAWNGERWIVVDTSEGIDLQGVLDNGSIANKGIVLTNASDDALLLSPEDARIMVGGVGPNVVPRLELRHKTGGLDTSIVKLELDEDGERFDIECDEKVDNIHFRFENDVKLELNKTGDAVFSGKVKVEPGTEDNEVVTYGQLATIAEELEQLAPSIEHGSWNWTSSDTPAAGEYTTIKEEDLAAIEECQNVYQQCIVDAGTDSVARAECNRALDSCVSLNGPGTSSDFSKVHQIKFNNQDSQGNDVTFDTAEVGQLIDVFNDSNEDYLTGEITEKNDTTFTIIIRSSKGFASGLGRVKIFTLNDEVGDLTNYVRKTGDEMTGGLSTTYTDFTDNDLVTKKYVDDNSGSPIGTIVFWGGLKSKIPSGWVECRGQTAPADVKALTGLSVIPDLKNWMPAGMGGIFGSQEGQRVTSKIQKHKHSVTRLEPGNTQGNPDGAKDSSSSRYSYWRGNSSENGKNGSNISRSTTEVGSDFTAPPVWIGVYIMRIA